MKKKSKLNAISQLMCWIYHDALKHHAKQALAFVIISGAGVGMQLGAFITAAYYARALENNRPFDKFGIFIQSPRDSLELLIAVALVIATGLISSAALSYFSRRLSLQLSVEYENACAERVFRIAIDLPVIGNKLLSDSLKPPHIVRLASSDARTCGRMLRICLLALFPAAVALLAGMILLKLNWMLTLFLMAVIPLGAFEYMNINRRSIQTARSFEDSHQALAKILREYFTSLELPLSEDFKKIKTSNRKDFTIRVLSGDKIRFLTQILTAIALCAVILFFGVSGVVVGTNLTYFVLYLLVLRYGMNNFLSLITLIANLSSNYPAIKRYHEFVEAYQSLEQSSLNHENGSPTLTYHSLKEQTHTTSIKELGPIIVLSKTAFSRQNFASISGALAGQQPVIWTDCLNHIQLCESIEHWQADCNSDKPYGNYLWHVIPKNQKTSHPSYLSQYFTVALLNGQLHGGRFEEMVEAYQAAADQNDKNWCEDDHFHQDETADE